MAGQRKNPYVGPRTFEEQDKNYYFGREGEAQALLSLVLANREVLFHATSGAGKSSLINARLIPALKQERLTPLRGRVWIGHHPDRQADVKNIFIYNLLSHLSPGEDPRQFSKLSLSEYLRTHHQIPTSEADEFLEPARILIIDQFEELFTTNEAYWQQREDFFRQLAEAMKNDRLLWLLLVMREDYVTSLDRYANLVPDKLRVRYQMERMRGLAALEAVKSPAEIAGLPFAEPVRDEIGPAEFLVNDLQQIRVMGRDETITGEFVEPVQMQIVCYSLWEALAQAAPAVITHDDVEAAADVDKTLSDYYDNAINHVVMQTEGIEQQLPDFFRSDFLDNASKRVAMKIGGIEQQLRDLFGKELITETETRGLVFRGDTHTGGVENEIIDVLDKNFFLLRSSTIAGGIWYELVHDRFIPAILESNRQAWIRLERERQVQIFEKLRKQDAAQWRRRILFYILPITVLLTVIGILILLDQNRNLQQANDMAEANYRNAIRAQAVAEVEGATADALATERSVLLEDQLHSLIDESTRLAMSEETRRAAGAGEGSESPESNLGIDTPNPSGTAAAIVAQIAAVELTQTAIVPRNKIVFQSNRDGDHEIYIMDQDGSNQQKLTDNSYPDQYPVVSPSGQKILFQSERDGNKEIYVMNLGGSDQRRLTYSDSDDEQPTWSPNETQIVFISDRSGNRNLHIMDADGGNEWQVTSGDLWKGHPSWSINNELVFNAGNMTGSTWEIYIVDIDGGNQRQLTNNTVSDWAPVWSPDGRWILYNSSISKDDEAALFAMNADGSNSHLVFTSDDYEWGSQWTPDGDKIVFTRERGEYSYIYIMDADGRNVRLIAERGSYPSWVR